MAYRIASLSMVALISGFTINPPLFFLFPEHKVKMERIPIFFPVCLKSREALFFNEIGDVTRFETHIQSFTNIPCALDR